MHATSLAVLSVASYSLFVVAIGAQDLVPTRALLPKGVLNLRPGSDGVDVTLFVGGVVRASEHLLVVKLVVKRAVYVLAPKHIAASYRRSNVGLAHKQAEKSAHPRLPFAGTVLDNVGRLSFPDELTVAVLVVRGDDSGVAFGQTILFATFACFVLLVAVMPEDFERLPLVFPASELDFVLFVAVVVWIMATVHVLDIALLTHVIKLAFLHS